MIKKKAISRSKFDRIRQNLNSEPCFAYRCKARSYTVEHAITAYKLGSYVYAVFKNKRQPASSLSTHCVRYWVDSHDRVDLFAYVKTLDSRV